jgi:hypothetical protein
MCSCQIHVTRYTLEPERENALQESGPRRSAGLVDANDLADVFVLVLGGINRLRDVICDLQNRARTVISSASIVTQQCTSARREKDAPPPLSIG